MSYRIDLNYDPYSGQIQVSYDDRMQTCIEQILNPELLLDKWPVDQLPATLIKYKSYDEWESVENEFSQQWADTQAPATKAIGPPDVDQRSKSSEYCPTEVYSEHNDSHLSDHFSDHPNDCDSSFSDHNTVAPPPKKVKLEYYDLKSPDTTSEELAANARLTGPELPESVQFSNIIALLENLQQAVCKVLCKELVKLWIPQKKSSYPYKCGDLARPPNWPRTIPHYQPDHLSKRQRMRLIAFILLQITPESRRWVFSVVSSRIKLGEPKLRALETLDIILNEADIKLITA